MGKKKSEYTEEETDIARDLDAAAALYAVSTSQGGKALINALISDTVGVVDSLSNTYKEATHMELLSLCAELKTKLDLLRSLSRSKINKDFLEEILAEKLKD